MRQLGNLAVNRGIYSYCCALCSHGLRCTTVVVCKSKNIMVSCA
jgi:hypothetical protein